jgi:hypothetical protein
VILPIYLPASRFVFRFRRAAAKPLNDGNNKVLPRDLFGAVREFCF